MSLAALNRMKNLSFLLLFLFFLVLGLPGPSMSLCPMDEAISKKINQDFSSLREDPPSNLTEGLTD